MKLTEQELQETYAQLETMYVELEDVPEKGLNYIRDRLMLCRAMQDQVHELRLKAGRAFSWVQEQLIYSKSALQLAETDQEKHQLKVKIAELQQDQVSHGMLYRLVQAQASVLSNTNRDIRLLSDVMVKQLKLGEQGGINPTETEGLTKEVTMEDLAEMLPGQGPVPQSTEGDVPSLITSTPATVQAPAAAAVQAPVPQRAGDDLDGLFGGAVHSTLPPVQPLPVPTPTPAATPAGVESVGMSAPLGVESVPRGIPVADHSAVPIESLFDGEMNGAEQPVPAHRAF